MGTKCSGCDAVIYDILYMECAQEICKKLYHLKCLGLTKEKFEELTEDYKNTWKCPECVCNAPKSDNLDTPVRNPIMNKTFTPSYVNTNRGNKLHQKEIVETDMECTAQILLEMREFRLEMKLRMEEQVREYSLLKERFVKAENELHQLRVTMKVLQEKANKADELEVQLKNMEQKSKQRQTQPINNKQMARERDDTMQEIREKTTFASVTSQTEKRVVQKHPKVKKNDACESTKTAPISTTETNIGTVDKKLVSATHTEEQVEHNKKGEEWTTVQNKKKNYNSKQVIKGGNTSSGNIQGAERKKFLHVWRLRKDTTKENLEMHVRSICGNNIEITVEKIKHKTERDYASFIIGVPESQYALLCKPECWAVNIEFCEWIWFRKPPKKP